MNKYRYIKDYVPASNHVNYTGDYYEFHLSDEAYHTMRIIILLGLTAISFLFVVTGFLNNRGSFCIYVLIPYLCILLPLTFLIRGYLRIPQKPQSMEYAIYDKCYNRIKFSLVGLILASITTILGDCLFILRNASEILLMKEMIFCVSSIAIAVISILLLRYHNRIVCEKLSAYR